MVTAVSSQFTKLWCLKGAKSSINIRTADSHFATAGEITATIQLYGRSLKQRFVIISNLIRPLVAGADFF